ncbi:phenazine biosynthesis PhzC/PhzF protein [Microdochium trichocladiopsis]|uniref:Phenazine biosynthesis PhzC/PhzF protein n=1 Tax=Microdochium trichocladiopsis TaxID=1682393 RepID=A0A9P9BHV9_9PEZI|nr:phenazine biosynthesis PhzC/PhzF protein [Microdochium trichocladiopsis]KAH7012442.1 phenazine biosynthesis PhzC/PhzF protein [Microdochium trichocladiopsis]
MELPFVTLDVFTTTPFKGNPLAVVTIPASLPGPPTQEQKQAIAREFNLSETVFVHDVDPRDDVNKHQRKIDIFLPDREIPFAGHPTVGAAVSLLPLGVRTVITKAGPIEITQTGPSAVQAGIPHDVRLHAKCPRDLDLSLPELSSDDTIRQAELDAKVVSIVNGMSFILVELPSLEALARVERSTVVFPTDELLDEGWRNSFIGRYYYVRTSTGEGGNAVSLRTRMIEKSFEDPATGSAASALCSYLSLKSGAAGALTRYEVTQGVEIGRESNITVQVGLDKDSKVDTVSLAGTAAQVMRGFVTL